ncbi:MAG: dinitrogenase iron-molybdenum cofactor [Firmicutes bacterium]|nr:dinitrogenase iron-molybdenum cofactor [Bacillota bacterium]
MEKIAVPTEGDMFAQHFGHCPQFTIVEVDENKVLNKEVIDNPGHQPGFLPKFLRDHGVDVIIAGGMGRKAVDLFNQFDIEVVTGASGSVMDGIRLYLEGSLETEEDICEH